MGVGIPLGIPMGTRMVMGWVWGLESNSHGSPGNHVVCLISVLVTSASSAATWLLTCVLSGSTFNMSWQRLAMTVT